MKLQVILLVCLLCSACLFPRKALSQEGLPQINIATINGKTIVKTDKDILRYGVESFGSGVYRDSLVNYLDAIQQVEAGDHIRETLIYQAIWGSDTLKYRVRPHILRTYTYDSEAKKKREILEVESQTPPFHRFTAIIEGLDDAAIAALTDSMLQMKAASSMLLNNSQTCIFYALEALFESNRICTDPVITRNSTFVQIKELNAFFDRFLTVTATYTCRYSELKGKTFPNNSLLAFIDDYGQIIHAAYYRDGVFHSKNGLFSPVVVATLKPILQAYGRWDNKRSGLSKEGKKMMAHQLAVYTVNEALFFPDTSKE